MVLIARLVVEKHHEAAVRRPILPVDWPALRARHWLSSLDLVSGCHPHIEHAVHGREPGDPTAIRRELRAEECRVVEQCAAGNEGTRGQVRSPLAYGLIRGILEARCDLATVSSLAPHIADCIHLTFDCPTMVYKHWRQAWASMNERRRPLVVRGVGMLQKLSDHIAHCLAQANVAELRASEASNQTVSGDYERLAQSWRHLASSYQFVETLERFLLDAERPSRADRARRAWRLDSANENWWHVSSSWH